MDARDAPSRCPSRSAHHLSQPRPAAVIILISLFSLTSFPLATIGGTGQTPIQHFKTNIALIASTFINDTTITVSTLTTPSWIPIQNESLIVVASSSGSFGPTQVNSVTDGHGDIFTRQIQQQYSSTPSFIDAYELEVWTTPNDASTFASNFVTVNWNESVNSHLVQVERYENIQSIGVKLSKAQNCPCNTTLGVTISKSGSWIFGAITTLSIPATPATTPCPGQIASPSPSFIRRADNCSTQSGTDGTETETSDNATTLRNGLLIAYSPVLGSVGDPAPFEAEAVMELTPIDLEPQEQNVVTSNFCQTTGDTCHINFANKVSGINTLQNIVVGTAYCTGITTAALTIGSASNVEMLSTYNGQSRNDTGAVLLVQLEISSNAPSLSFGAGQCATGAQIIANSKITFASSGAATTPYGLNEFGIGVSGVCSQGSGPCNAGGTVYGWLEITPQSVGNVMTGVANGGATIQYAQWAAAGHSTISIFQIK